MKTLLKSLLFAVIAAFGVPAFAAPENHEEFARQYMPESQAVFERFRKDCAETQKLRESLAEDLRVMNRALAGDAGYSALSEKIAELERQESEWANTIQDAFFKHKARMISSEKLSEADIALAKKSIKWERDVLNPLLKRYITGFYEKWCDNVVSHLETVPIPGKNYEFGKYEVTISQYRNIMGTVPEQNESHSEECPVANVTPWSCERFCQKLTEKARREGMISENWEYRLPHLDEWEHACRANSTTKYYTSDTLDDIVDSYASMVGRAASSRRDDADSLAPKNQKHPVGQKKPNAFGLYDMIGNVEETVYTVVEKPYVCGYWTFKSYYSIGSSSYPCRPMSVRDYVGDITRGFRVVLAPKQEK